VREDRAPGGSAREVLFTERHEVRQPCWRMPNVVEESPACERLRARCRHSSTEMTDFVSSAKRTSRAGSRLASIQHNWQRRGGRIIARG
jgi:hypothetical protein